MTGDVQAQPYYDGMDNNYNSYEPEYSDKKHDSYGSTDYGMDDSYGSALLRNSLFLTHLASLF